MIQLQIVFTWRFNCEHLTRVGIQEDIAHHIKMELILKKILIHNMSHFDTNILLKLGNIFK